ncbi:hypothetical protein CXB49_04565 [Chromobacterium sp. ATCC 53434]|uniref:glyceraldehyde 3-phosphate dehydrogenase NAD-binding domain-containing protein n=1 Tax=Chromobacterium sp. (strain ATCC 53434 / SC 14030) TaxID=2059672 RepID=UPI000C78B162|nr:glyceraldehyde 3-phosphate dehydrogenase NAD-binding domain-containing protein [Chromobacterium sp. ATCC 53434]AUH50143.1 hypothetical protein CXB49_04565 [Chromobacterium sp. ATCC 53434]
MRKLKVGLNGLGRIGRTLFRINQQRQLFDLVLINDVQQDAANLAYLLKYDSIHGPLPERIGFASRRLTVGEQAIALSHCADVTAAPWLEHGIDVLIDASGDIGNPARLAAWRAFSGWTVTTHAVSHPEVSTVVFGVNEHAFDPRRQRRLATSICDAVALAPVAALLQRHFGIARGYLLTLHPWLGQQRLQDGPALTAGIDALQSHFALGRAAVGNLIPKTTSALQAADAVLPGLSQKLQALSYRVPTNIVCSAVLDVELERPTGARELDALLRQAEQRQTLPILRNGSEPLVSNDYRGSHYSAIVDQRWTAVQHQRHARLMYWYDNEWGYSSRVMDLVEAIAREATGG